ncbi:MAG TPA: c-type cytochrome [Luteibacter sp.]|jgi:mono/diheme cytochrome c family protein|nr:c-type cytochrome [Luteibacter sp.]
MKPTIRHSLLVTGLLLAHAAFAQNVPDPVRGPPGDAAHGHHLFLTVGCYQCHGTSGEGGGVFGPKLAPDPLPFIAVDHQLRSPAMRMPVYTAKVLSDQDVADIYAYLKSIPPSKQPDQIPLLKIQPQG